jgi:ABC-type multidrug transport system ATPase subunit
LLGDYKTNWKFSASLLLSDHNFREVHQVTNRIMLLDGGYLQELSKPEELIPYGYFQQTK